MIRTSFIRLFRVACCTVVLVCTAQVQTQKPAADDQSVRRRQNEGLYNEMRERHAEWRKLHDEFDSAVGTLIRRAATGSKDPEKAQVLAELCSSVQRSRLNTAVDLLHQQLDAQSRYFTREQVDATKAVEEENRVITNRRELENQRLNDVKNAEKEMQFMKDQYSETEATREGVQSSPERVANLNMALEQLGRAIKVREEKLEELKSEEGFNKITLDSLETTRLKIEGLLRQNQDNVSIIDARRTYYEAYYSMRSAQMRQFCVDDRIDMPLKD